MLIPPQAVSTPRALAGRPSLSEQSDRQGPGLGPYPALATDPAQSPAAPALQGDQTTKVTCQHMPQCLLHVSPHPATCLHQTCTMTARVHPVNLHNPTRKHPPLSPAPPAGQPHSNPIAAPSASMSHMCGREILHGPVSTQPPTTHTCMKPCSLLPEALASCDVCVLWCAGGGVGTLRRSGLHRTASFRAQVLKGTSAEGGSNPSSRGASTCQLVRGSGQEVDGSHPPHHHSCSPHHFTS